MLSKAMVARIKHVPDVAAVSVATEDVSESAQEVAVPPDAIEKEIAPVPLVPVVVILRACEYG